MVAVGETVRVSGVEQIDEEGAIIRPGDVLQEQLAKLSPKFGIVFGVGQSEGAGDDLAPRVALAFAMRRATRVELAAGFTLIGS
jgi:hypothetical protein